MSDVPTRQSSTASSGLTERLRLGLAVALAAAAGAHLPVLTEHLQEAPWLGWLFVTFIFAALGAAAGTLLVRTSWLPVASVALTAAAIGIYCATRLFPFPQLSNDVGDWSDPWGLASIALELTALVTAAQLRRQTGKPAR